MEKLDQWIRFRTCQTSKKGTIRIRQFYGGITEQYLMRLIVQKTIKDFDAGKDLELFKDSDKNSS